MTSTATSTARRSRLVAAGVLVLIVAAATTGLLGVPHGVQEVVGGGGGQVATSGSPTLWALGAGLTLCLLALMYLAALTGEISPRRVTSFTVRQYLRLTPDNAGLVGGALTVQYRWRRLGLWAGGVVGILLTGLFGTVQLSLAAILGGWFVGAAFAEFRVSRPVESGPRRAVLATRSTGRFTTLGNRVAVASVGGLAVVLLVTAVAVGVANRNADWLQPSVVLVLVWAALFVLYRRVVGRPAPAEPADLVAADDALRCQSLAVLSGSAVALSGFPAAQLAVGVFMELGMPGDSAGFIGGCLVVGLALLGWWLASWSTSPRRGRSSSPGAIVVDQSQGLA